MFDTNVLVSAFLLAQSKPRQALGRALQQGRVLLSFASLAELYEVLAREKFRRYISEEDVRTVLAALTREAQWVEVDIQVTICRDPKDNKFLELAVSGKATHIITGDTDLLVLNPFQGVRILTPNEFLENATAAAV